MFSKIANLFKSSWMIRIFKDSWRSLLKLVVVYIALPVLNLVLKEHTAKVDVVTKKLDELTDVLQTLSKSLADKDVTEEEINELVDKIKVLISKLDTDD